MGKACAPAKRAGITRRDGNPARAPKQRCSFGRVPLGLEKRSPRPGRRWGDASRDAHHQCESSVSMRNLRLLLVLTTQYGDHCEAVRQLSEVGRLWGQPVVSKPLMAVYHWPQIFGWPVGSMPIRNVGSAVPLKLPIQL